MVNLPKWRNTYCPHPKCKSHKKFKVTQYKKSAESKQAQGRRRWVYNQNVTNKYHDLIICQIWPQAAGIRRSVQAYPEEEGQDHQEAGPQAGVHWVPVEKPGNLAESEYVY